MIAASAALIGLAQISAIDTAQTSGIYSQTPHEIPDSPNGMTQFGRAMHAAVMCLARMFPSHRSPGRVNGSLLPACATRRADLTREGYELREGEIKPNVHREPHAHEFDARLFVLEGSITLVFKDGRCTYGPGDSCNVPAGTMHEEHTGADGVRYLAGRRPAAAAE